ncbi:ADP-ribosyltransferase-containing protein [Paralysiella testudinis]|uniref:ART-PolyVal-like domain-containing protein n=1 Tax=Paralysiella testudinis TaxID=2809020 RepID=A0A892ZML8_9NEIS|nr:hypothetical protein [Paralysiella testudinis]QRQ82864.1 hypothetical protein JQU52_05650 [Paralysiella testudinis]
MMDTDNKQVSQRFDPQQNDIRYSHAPAAAGHSQEIYDTAKAAGQTELTYLQWQQVRTPEFKAWFGDWENDPANASKVINQNTGEPLVMYHTSGWNPLAEQPGKAVFRQGTNGGLSGDGIYFSEYPLGQFGSHVTEVFLNIRNPLNRETTKDEKYDAAYENLHLEEAAECFFMRGFLKKDALKLFPEFDGVHNRSESVVVHPEQIKSATDNIGRFAPNEADIRYRLSPEHEIGAAAVAGATPNTEQQQTDPATAIRAQLEQVLGDKAVLVNVVDAAQQPPHQAMRLISGSVEGWFDGRSGQINLVAATVTPERAAWVAWHELGHRGVALAHFDDYRAVMQDADQNSTVRALADAVQQERRQYRFDPAADKREVAVEEALVELYAAQKTGNYAALETRYGVKVPAAVKPGIAGTLQRVAEKLSTVLNQVFGRQPHNAFGHAEVFGLLHVIDRHSGKNADPDRLNTGVRYSQAPSAPSSSSSTATEPDHAAQRLARAKDNYHSQSYLLTNAERQHRAVLEYGMEKLTAAMPPALKAEAQANFYENQVRQTANLMDVPMGFRLPETSVISSVSPMTSAQASAAANIDNQSDHEIDR